MAQSESLRTITSPFLSSLRLFERETDASTASFFTLFASLGSVSSASALTLRARAEVDADAEEDDAAPFRPTSIPD